MARYQVTFRSGAQVEFVAGELTEANGDRIAFKAEEGVPQGSTMKFMDPREVVCVVERWMGPAPHRSSQA